jgi:hypothetical protein
MSSNYFRQYGGTKNLEKFNNITAVHITADTFSIHYPYRGKFDISGDLFVNNDTFIYGNLDVGGDIVFNGTVALQNNVDIIGEMTVNGNIYGKKDIINYGNTLIYGNSQINSNVIIYDKLLLGSDQSTYFFGNLSGVGLNNYTPNATLDICGNRNEVLNVYSNQELNQNIIARNVNSKGIVVNSNTKSSYIDFYNDVSINPININGNLYGARLAYYTGGVFDIDVSDNTQIKSKLSISNRSSNVIGNYINHIKGETVAIYDISSSYNNSIYLQNIYNNSNIKTGSALSLISGDNSSNTFLNIITPNITGISIGGGAFPNDTTRHFGTIGWTDICSNFNPIQNFVSGKNASKYKTTIGFNTNSPRTENYVLDINGPIHITNGSLVLVGNVYFKINHVGSGGGNSVIAVGTPLNISPLKRYALYSIDGGQSFNLSNNINLNPQADNIINTIFVYDNSFSFIGCNGASSFYSINSGLSWYEILFSSSVNIGTQNLNSIFVNNNNFYFAYKNELVYFNLPINNTIFTGYNNTTVISYIENYNSLFNYKYINGYESGNVYIIGGNSITGNIIKKYSGLNNIFSSIYTTPYSIYYNSINVFNNNNIIAVGGNIISYTNRGSYWTDISLNNIILNSVLIIDFSNAIAVGNNGNILYTTNSYSNWNNIPFDFINSSGNGKNLLDTSFNYTSISMSDKNTFVISGYNPSINLTKLFYLFVPNLFNRINNSVVDVCGNMNITGDIHFNTEGSIVCDNYNNLLNLNGNLQLNGITYGKYFEPLSYGNINIGSLSNTGNINIGTSITYGNDIINIGTVANNAFSTINIGNPTNAFGGAINYINIGGDYDKIIIRGNIQTSSVEHIISTGKTINLNDNSNPANIPLSAGSGIIINDLDNTVNGFITTSNNLDGFYFKSSGQNSNNIVDLNTQQLQLPFGLNNGIMLNDVSNGILILQKSYNDPSCNFLINVGTIDISNITLKECLDPSSNDTFQVISTQLKINDRFKTISNSPTTGSLQVVGGVGITGNNFIGGNLNVFQNSNLLGNLYVKNDSILNGNLMVSQNYNLLGNLFVKNDSILNGNLQVSQNYNLLGNLSVKNDSVLNGNLQVSQNYNLFGNLYVKNDSILNGNLQVSQNYNLLGNLSVKNDSILNGNLLVSQNYNLLGNLSVKNDSILNGNLLVSQNYNLLGNLYVKNDSILNGNLLVSQNYNLLGNLYVKNDSILNGNLQINKNTNLNGNLQVKGNTILLTGNDLYIDDGYIKSLTGSIRLQPAPATNLQLNVNKGIDVGDIFLNANSINSNTYISNGSLFMQNNGYSSLYFGSSSSSCSCRIFGTLTSNYYDYNGSLFFRGFTSNNNGNINSTNIIFSNSGDINASGTLYAGVITGGSLTSGTINVYNLIAGAGGISTVGLTIGTNGLNMQTNPIYGGSTTSTTTNLSVYGLSVGSGGITGWSPNLSGYVDTSTTQTIGGTKTFSIQVTAPSFNATSDYRIKSNVFILNNNYSVDNLKPVVYFNELKKTQDIGFIAHEVQDEFPFLVNGIKDDVNDFGEPIYQSLNYQGIIPILVKEIQDLKKELQDIKNKILF